MSKQDSSDNLHQTDDVWLIRQCLGGDTEAFGLLVDKYKASVFALALSRVHSFHNAQDITQEVFIKAYTKLPTIRHWDRFTGWLYTITANLCNNFHAAQVRRPDRGHLDGHTDARVEELSLDSYELGNQRKGLHEAISSLPETYAEVLTLYYIGGLSTKEIARFTSSKPGTVAQRLRRARNQLRTELLEELSGESSDHHLQPDFTFRVLLLVRQIPLKPALPLQWLPWGFSALAGVILTFTHLTLLWYLYLAPSDRGWVFRGEGESATLSVSLLTLESAPDLGSTAIGNTLRTDGSPSASSGSGLTSNEGPASQELTGRMGVPRDIEWTRHTQTPVLSRGSDGWDAYLVRLPSVLIDPVAPPNERYKMWFDGHDNARHERIGYATSPLGINWTKHPANPVLQLGTTWDSYHVDQPSVLIDPAAPTNERYKMWYVGYDGTNYSIGHAISADGVHWRKYPTDEAPIPVLAKGAPGQWDSFRASSPTVCLNEQAPAETRYQMWYVGKARRESVPSIGYATSSDGIRWTKHPANPVLGPRSDGMWDDQGVSHPSVLIDPLAEPSERYKMWYDGLSSQPDGGRIGYAVSSDGVAWGRSDGPALSPGTGWDEWMVNRCSVVLDGETFRMWYGGKSRDDKRVKIGHAVGSYQQDDVSVARFMNSPRLERDLDESH